MRVAHWRTSCVRNVHATNRGHTHTVQGTLNRNARDRLPDPPHRRIAYDLTGAGPLVICLPGLGDLRSVYRFLAPALAEVGFRVATMDLRGHGESDTTYDAYDDVAAPSGGRYACAQ